MIASVERTNMVKAALLMLPGFFLLCSVSIAAETGQPGRAPAAKTDQTLSVPSSVESDIAAVKTRLGSDPSNFSLHIKLGYLLLQKGSLDEARSSFDEALKLNARAHDAITGKGIVLRKQGNLAEAERVLTEALHLNPNPVRTHYELGLAYEQLGMPEKAVSEFKEGIRKHEQGR